MFRKFAQAGQARFVQHMQAESRFRFFIVRDEKHSSTALSFFYLFARSKTHFSPFFRSFL